MKKWKSRMFLGVIAITMVLGLALSSPSPTYAVQYTLAELLGDPYNPGQSGVNVTIGDKIFGNWRGFSSFVSGGANKVDPSGLLVTFTEVNPNFYTLRYQGGVFVAGPRQTQDTFFSYDVTTVGGAALIHDDTLRLIAAATVGTGTLFIAEQIFDLGGLTVGDKLVYLGGGISITYDEATWDPPRSFIYVTKDIGLVGGTDGAAAMSDFEQGYSQSGKIPEPISLILLGSGLAGAGLYRRLRKPRG
jgi:hypothetical protein